MEQTYEKEISKRNSAINNLLRCMQQLVNKNKEFNEAHTLYYSEIEQIRSQMSKSARELNHTFNNHAECVSKMQELQDENEMLRNQLKRRMEFERIGTKFSESSREDYENLRQNFTMLENRFLNAQRTITHLIQINDSNILKFFADFIFSLLRIQGIKKENLELKVKLGKTGSLTSLELRPSIEQMNDDYVELEAASMVNERTIDLETYYKSL